VERKTPEDVNKEIGERLRAARQRARLPQQHIATVMAMTHGYTTWRQTTVGRVETGERSLQLGEALAVADIIGIPLADLVSEEPTRLEIGARRAELGRLRDLIDQRDEELRG
jgi:transcriptional regulator with XRE-family HTH domain